MPGGDVDAFAEKINLLADSPGLRKEMGEYNRAKVEKMLLWSEWFASIRNYLSRFYKRDIQVPNQWIESKMVTKQKMTQRGYQRNFSNGMPSMYDLRGREVRPEPLRPSF